LSDLIQKSTSIPAACGATQAVGIGKSLQFGVGFERRSTSVMRGGGTGSDEGGDVGGEQ
jgi:hypothetical protein